MAERTTGGGDGRFYSRSWWWHCVGRFGVNSLSCSCRVGFAPDYIADTDNKQASKQAIKQTYVRSRGLRFEILNCVDNHDTTGIDGYGSGRSRLLAALEGQAM